MQFAAEFTEFFRQQLIQRKRERQMAGDGNGRGAVDRVAEKNATVCALTAPAWSNNSRKPSRASVAWPRPLMNSPQTRWRG